MNIHHAAALALVGWYLMVPPNPAGVWNSSAPLSQWQLYDRFETLAECRQFKDDQLKKFVDVHDSDGRGMIAWSESIATDDPRLKDK